MKSNNVNLNLIAALSVAAALLNARKALGLSNADLADLVESLKSL